MDGIARLGDINDRGPLIPQHRKPYGLIDVCRQTSDHRDGNAHRVEQMQADQAELQRERAQLVAASQRVLLDQPKAAETDQIGMSLRRGHAGLLCQVAQTEWSACFDQCGQQPAADLYRLYATPAFSCLLLQ